MCMTFIPLLGQTLFLTEQIAAESGLCGGGALGPDPEALIAGYMCVALAKSVENMP